MFTVFCRAVHCSAPPPGLFISVDIGVNVNAVVWLIAESGNSKRNKYFFMLLGCWRPWKSEAVRNI
jgi:hypothetical protein